MGCGSVKMNYEFNPSPMPDPFSVYVPLESLTEPVVRSIISVATQNFSRNENNSERTLLIFLLAINKKLEEIEKTTDDATGKEIEKTTDDATGKEIEKNTDATGKEIEKNTDATGKKIDEHIIRHAEQVRKWLVDNDGNPLNWDKLQKRYEKTADRRSDDSANDDGGYYSNRYEEFSMKPYFNDMKRSRDYMKKSRMNGFNPEELKVYWNAGQLENLCPKSEEESGRTPPHDPSDSDAVKNLREYPVRDRNHSGTFKYVNKGIEKAVFDVPEDAQIIVLNFANEQSPGGGYLRHAWAQEEIILYNSDGYRALLDLKYGRMSGGYAIPEFGLAYVRDICFYDPQSQDKCRKTDMLVSACYCMNGQELYANPRTKDEWKKKNLEKFRAFMSAAVANTRGNGENTYLLLGPIGTGAFGNDVGEIGEVFRDVLKMPMMQSKAPVRYAFSNIWFVSTDAWKNDVFKEIFRDIEPDTTENN